MQRIAHCLLHIEDKVLLLQKPKRGWWVAPGGKVEEGESIGEAVQREFQEETGLSLKNPLLKGVFSIIIEENNKIIDEWMLFTYYAKEYEGELITFSPEGIVSWHKTKDVNNLPMAAGDQKIFAQLINGEEQVKLFPLTGKFYYTPEYQLISYQFDNLRSLEIAHR